MNIKNNCRYFRGDLPCIPNKENNFHCLSCDSFDEVKQKILIIKLGAIGDVVRTTPILHKIKNLYPKALIYWLTHTPEILPNGFVDLKLKFDLKNILIVEETEFDFVFNLDKDWEACALMNKIKSRVKKGYFLLNGKPAPLDNNAMHKYLTGIFDEESKNNKKHYIQEIFEICDIGEFNDEHYIINKEELNDKEWEIDRYKKSIIGLNTGCGSRWQTRLWPISYWKELSGKLIQLNYEVILLGGEQEHERNLEISKETGAKYFGYYSIPIFIELIEQCDLIVTQVTMALHLAISLSKKVILLNNIFNKNEFYLYNLGKIIEPPNGCDCYYAPKCYKEKDGNYSCMKDISVNEILKTIVELTS
jgi:heptosyltransferase-2